MKSWTPSQWIFVLGGVTAFGIFAYEVVRGTVVFDAKDFVLLVSMAFAFYFGKPADPNGPVAGK